MKEICFNVSPLIFQNNSVGFSTIYLCATSAAAKIRLPGFFGPSPSTALNKDLLSLLYYYISNLFFVI